MSYAPTFAPATMQASNSPERTDYMVFPLV